MQVRNPPGSGKDIAEDKGVHREVESEGSRMSGKVLTRRANLWPDEQKLAQEGPQVLPGGLYWVRLEAHVWKGP